MAETGEEPKEIPRNYSTEDQHNDAVTIRKPKNYTRRAVLGGLLGLGALSTKTGRRLARTELEKGGLVDRKFSRELPPLRDYQLANPKPNILVIPILGKGDRKTQSLIDLEGNLEEVVESINHDSYGKMQVSFDILPPQAAKIPEERDKSSVVSKIGDSIAKKLGKDLDNYDVFLYLLQSDDDPEYGGVAFSASRDGRYKRAIAYTSDDVGYFQAVVKHELGHTFGLTHANSKSGGKEIEYGGKFDAMGQSDSAYNVINAPHRVRLGWIGKDQITSVSREGFYPLSHIDLQDYAKGTFITTGVRVLRVQKPDTNERYYISLQSGGMSSSAMRVHKWNEKPGTVPDELFPPGNQRWSAGKEFVDKKNGIRITLVPHDSSSEIPREPGQMVVKVEFDKK